MHNKNSYKTVGSNFGWVPVIRLQKTAAGDLQPGDIKVPCPDRMTLSHKVRKERDKRKCFFFFFQKLCGGWNIFSCWMLPREDLLWDSWWSVTLPSCYVQFNLKRKMCRYLKTIYMCGRLLSVSSRTKERTKDFFNDFGDMRWVLCGSVVCNHQYHDLNVVIFSQCYCFHPCFLLYYSISEWCQVLYMVWIHVCEEIWESVQEDALFLLWNILSLLISKQELCLFRFCDPRI